MRFRLRRPGRPHKGGLLHLVRGSLHVRDRRETADRQAPRRPAGPYMGQTPPGRAPQVFAPGIISTVAHEFSCSFSPDATEFYFTRRDVSTGRTAIMVTTLAGGTWTDPEPARFSRGQMEFEPMVTPDGLRNLLHVGPAAPRRRAEPDEHLVRPARQRGLGGTHAGWKPLQSDEGNGRLHDPRRHNLHDRHLQGPGTERIVVARLVDDGPGRSSAWARRINSGTRDMYPYVAPDER